MKYSLILGFFELNSIFVIKKNGNIETMLDSIWTELKTLLSFVKFKTNIDVYWKEAYKKDIILIKSYQFLFEDGFRPFKDMICMNKALHRMMMINTSVLIVG